MSLLLSHASGFQRRKWRVVSIYTGLVVSLTGGAVLAGWVLDLPWLKTAAFTGPTAMKANTAMAFVATGLSLLLAVQSKEARARVLRRFKVGEIAAAFPLLLGSLTILQYLLRWDFGIDQLLFHDDTALTNTAYPGRMGLNTAINFVLTGSALLALQLRRSQARVAQACALAIGAIALQALVGYAYEVRTLHQITADAGSMAFPTVLTFMAVAIALLCAEPDRGLMQPLTSPLIGGVVAQQLFLAILIFPLLFGWIVLQGWRYGWYDAAFAISALVLLLITIATLLIWKTATILNRKDQQRQSAEFQLKEALENLRDREARISRLADANIIGILFGDVEGSISRANDELLRIIGYRRQELEAGQISWIDLTPPEFLPLDRLRVAEAQAYGACTPYEKEYIR